jgi:predicted O-linked N-acetylglucosamine transferase (SPINDLY family)
LADPPGAADQLHSEKLIRLDGPAWCYQAPLDAPEVRDLPALGRGHVTFCSFNNPVKYSDRTIELWSAVLAAVPAARLLLKGKPLSDSVVADRLRERFARRGVKVEQLELRGWTKRGDDHFAAYHEADIALDTFPYHGTTTTCEALWMGVPVVTRAGEAHAARVGVSLLTHVGFPEMVANNDAEFVRTAAQLAADWPRLRQIRHELRERMRSSVLMNGPDFARRFLRACTQMANVS